MASGYVVHSSRIAYENRWTRVREDEIQRMDGSNGVYGVVERADLVVIVPWRNEQLTLVEQYRYPVGMRLWEFPMGMWEQAPDADPVKLAMAELQEETGLTAGKLLQAGEIFQGPGYCTQRGHVFLATDLTQGDPTRESSEQDMICRDFPLKTFEAMIRDGMVRDAMTIAAFGLLRMKGLL